MLNKSQHQLVAKLTEYVLSEFSSDEEPPENKVRHKLFPGIYLWDDVDQIEQGDFLDAILND